MDADLVRIARFLAAGNAVARAAANPAKVTLDGSRGVIAVDAEALAQMARRGLIERLKDGVALSDAGMAFLRRHRRGGPDFQAQHRDLETASVEVGGEVTTATVNRAESPLLAIARRKNRDGSPFLTRDELGAGERLRSDYTRGQLMPRLGANWQAAVASGTHRGERGGVADLTDAALGARQRVENAIRAVGPELSGILIDVCCYLKGLETVEREREWPARSAKIVLKSALSALARHYAPDRASRSSSPQGVLHWGADDYRPSIR
ncbi:MAG: hypothetical protein JJ913_14340 [Rhizobiaceae bacterium]|nr:hypothetical protein [Rhizobiaceae bacterium]